MKPRRISPLLLVAGCAAAAVVPLSAWAQATDRLLVQDSGSNTHFVVRDDGTVGVGMGAPLYQVDVSGGGVAKSSLHFSKDGTDVGGWITSVGDNNFFLSSGAMYDLSQNGWVQKSGDGRAVMAGSGALGYRIFTHIGGVAGSGITLDQARLHIDFDGNLGLNTPAVPGVPIQHVSGAHLTFGGVWTDASSRDYKENVRPLTTEQAMQAVTQLVPVTYNYKVDSEERHVGFIAEDVPELVATKDRKSLSPMDIVAALTKVVQEQRQQLQAEKARGDSMEGRLQQLAAEVARLQARVPK